MRKHLRLHRVSVLELEQLFAVALDAEVGLVGRGGRRDGAGAYNVGKNGKPRAEGVHGIEGSQNQQGGGFQRQSGKNNKDDYYNNSKNNGWTSNNRGDDSSPKRIQHTPREEIDKAWREIHERNVAKWQNNSKRNGWRNKNYGDDMDNRKCYVCDKEGHSWMTCYKRKSGNGCARCGSSAHRLRSCPQRIDLERKNSTQTDKSDPLMYMLETKVMEVTRCAGRS